MSVCSGLFGLNCFVSVTTLKRLHVFFKLKPCWHDRNGLTVSSGVLIASFTTSPPGVPLVTLFLQRLNRALSKFITDLGNGKRWKKKHLAQKKLLREKERERLWSNRYSWKVIRCQRSWKWSSVSQRVRSSRWETSVWYKIPSRLIIIPSETRTEPSLEPGPSLCL